MIGATTDLFPPHSISRGLTRIARWGLARATAVTWKRRP